MNLSLRRLANQRGFSILELLVEFVVVVIVALGVATILRSNNHRMVQGKENSFASQKAVQMMEELRAVSATAGENTIGALDTYSDVTDNPVLTTVRGITNPADPLSGNANGHYVRHINIEPLVPPDPLARRVFVKIYRASDHAVLAETMSVIYNAARRFSSTQVYDVYLLALEGISSDRTPVSTVYDQVNGAMQDIQTRKPGLEFRIHKVTRVAYGRDPYYTPNINTAQNSSVSGVLNWAYLYLGRVNGTLWNNPASFTARIKVDGTNTNGTPGIVQPGEHSLADLYNHAVRSPDEEALFLAEQAVNPRAEISWRMLLDRLNQPVKNTPQDEFQNVIIINLHGTTLPIPPIRNYSDAAKDPTTHLYWRAVTHPERLTYDSDPSASQIKLRVYTYLSEPSSDTEIDDLTIQLPVTLRSSDIQVFKLDGDASTAYAWRTAAPGLPNDYDFNPAGYTLGTTVLRLHHTPLKAPLNAGKGLANPLYGLEYIPCRVEAVTSGTLDFQQGVSDLTDTGTNPKNTARWRIEISRTALSPLLSKGYLAVETRIGSALTNTDPSNLSRTYVWVSRPPPVSETFQFLGDPRHMPYSDVKMNKGFNWYFRQIGAPYQGYGDTADGWQNWSSSLDPQYEGYLNFDLPRYLQLLRGGLLNSSSFLANTGGALNFLTAMGGEQDSDAVSVSRLSPWRGTTGGTTTGVIDEIGSRGVENYNRIIARTNLSWVSIPWLGELAPDNDYSAWRVNGNLATPEQSSAPKKYYRAPYPTAYSSYPRTPVSFANSRGTASLANGSPVSTSSVLYYLPPRDAAGQTGTVTSSGVTFNSLMTFALPSQIAAEQPFTLQGDEPAYKPVEWFNSVYSTQRTTLSTLDTLYDSSAGLNFSSSGHIQITASVNGQMKGGYLVSSGLWTPSHALSPLAGKMVTSSVLRGFFDAGHPNITVGTAHQLPFLTITNPPLGGLPLRNVSSIPVDWTVAWTRWDGNPYTEFYPLNFSEYTPLLFNATYSADGGNTWKWVNTNTLNLTPGKLDRSRLVTSGFQWSLVNFAPGTYILRVESHRDAIDTHYAYQQQTITIQP